MRGLKIWFPFNILSRFMVYTYFAQWQQTKCFSLPSIRCTKYTTHFWQFRLCMWCDRHWIEWLYEVEGMCEKHEKCTSKHRKLDEWGRMRKCGRKLFHFQTNVNYNWLCLLYWMAENSFECIEPLNFNDKYIFKMQKLQLRRTNESND